MTGTPLRRADCLWPAWPVSPRVRAFVTTRNGGVSAPPYGSGSRDASGGAEASGLNLGLHTGDAPAAVLENRRRVLELADAPAAWLEQVHGARIEDAGALIDRCAGSPEHGALPVKADASVTAREHAVCVVMVADCLPVLFADAAGRAVGAAHAGWRGLAAGIVEQTAERVAALGGGTGAVHAYLGPAIGPRAFEVGEDVLAAFAEAAHPADRDATAAQFAPTAKGGKFLADIYALARLRLARAGVDSARVHGGTHCTVTERALFYSYRRERVTGRMAAMIWLAD